VSGVTLFVRVWLGVKRAGGLGPASLAFYSSWLLDKPSNPLLLTAGVTTFDTSDAFGPAEALIGQFRNLSPRVADECQVLTKLTFMGAPGRGATTREMIE